MRAPLVRRGRWAAIALTVVVTAGIVVAPRPAGAIEIGTGTTDILPVTWVDGTGRQYVAMSAGPEGALQVARTTRSGAPDATWGTLGGKKGVRKLTIQPPAYEATMHRLLAASDGGILTTVWEDRLCASPADTCDRWYVRTGADGTPVGSPVLVPTSAPPLRGLTDGSILTGTDGGPIGWRAPTGTDRGAPALTTTQLRGAAVDGGGRLLLTSTAGVITRWPAGGPADLTLPTSCTAGLAIGAPLTDDGFATVCGASSAGGVVTTRYESAGTVRWSTTGVRPEHATLQPSRVAVDSTDRVWVAGRGTVANNGYDIPVAAIASVAEAGPGTTGYQRWAQGISNYDTSPSGVFDLRPVLGTRAAFADLHNCCKYAWGDVPSDEVIADILPKPTVTPAVPTCLPRSPKVVAATRTSATVSFQGCASGSGGPAPTRYLAESRNYYTPYATTTPLPSTADATLTATVEFGSPPDVSVYVSAINAEGESEGSVLVRTILPFRSVDAFFDRQYLDLVGHLPSPAERAQAEGWLNNHTADNVLKELLERGRAHQAVEPIARLYKAYLLRNPDLSGLRYWVRKREAGATLARISEQFARSGEFTRRYGSLTNRQFVEQIYRNVLGREGDPDGIAFWTKRLDDRRMTRGAVMLNFSESNEYVTKTGKDVQPTAVFFLMLGRLPTSADSELTSDWTRERVAYRVLMSAEYDDLVA